MLPRNTTEGTTPHGLFSGKERFKLIAMGMGVVLIAIALLYVDGPGRGEGGAADANVPEAPTQEIVIAPKIDVASFASLTRDATTGDRVVLEGDALERAFTQSSLLRDAVFDPLGGLELDTHTYDELVRRPADRRGQLYRVWGRVAAVQQLAASNTGNPRNLIRVDLEGGDSAFLAVMLFPEGPPRSGDFLRFDGLFLKLFRDDTEQGWIEGPLLVGPRAISSFPRMDPVASLAPGMFDHVRDDNVMDGSSGLPPTEFWSLVSYVQNLSEGDVDWDAAPVLDNELISSIFADGTDWRGKPVRIPVCMVLGLWNQPQKENPLRIEKLAEGWLGHQPWVGQAKLVRFVSPFENETVRQRLDQVTARAFFFKNLAYSPKHGGAGIAPFFVVHSMQIATPVEAKGLYQLMWVVGGIFLILVAAIVLLLRRDQARSRALQEDLLRRRRMRRARLST